ncbi:MULTISPECIES: hypothetical protein [unclassified Shewanella]|uniref:hypothetical protein n=1 Tax=unclassified Shewanella TaxID=196818 RepID=UPI000C828A22|nr:MULTISPECIES: hypothetical protein [unclassified Shewanella]MDO6679990.1 hypothetical protein [Shewanella sp. 4_MG-2023]PMH86029.1 hypothetical protein BCU57_12625 [Shewanella sp. 10N.286.48.B5]
MKEKEFNYQFCGFSVVIRNGKGRAKFGKDVVFDTSGESHEKIKSELENQIVDHRISLLTPFISEFDIDTKVLLGLIQIPAVFAERLIHQMHQYANNWGMDVNVRFGLLGMLAEGKPGFPNYQIETSDSSKKETFKFSGEHYGYELFEEGHITPPMSTNHLRAIWCLQ